MILLPFVVAALVAPPQPISCEAWYDAARAKRPGAARDGEPSRAGKPSAKTHTSTTTTAIGAVELALPEGMTTRTVEIPGGTVFEGAAGEQPHRDPGQAVSWAPVPLVQVWLQAEADPGAEARWNARLEVADLYPSTVDRRSLATTFLGRPARELCAHVWLSPGHATLMDGTHEPLPYERHLTRIVFFEWNGHQVTLLYRIPGESVADWAPIFRRAFDGIALRP